MSITTTTTETSSASALCRRWQQLLENNPRLRIYDAALELGVSELALRLTCTGTSNVLRPDWPALFSGLQRLGRVMALTRNRHAVHERKGEYSEAAFFGLMGQVNGADIDLRMLMHSWGWLVAVEEEAASGALKRSFQIFDRTGCAVHKVHLLEESHAEEFDKLALNLTANDGELPPIDVRPPVVTKSDSIDSLDQDAFLTEWSLLKDTHEFFGLLKRHKVLRLRAMKVAEGRYTRALRTDCLRSLLEAAAERFVPIMVFVGNPGMIQIHSGPVQKIVMAGKWLNVLDDVFNLHLDASGVFEVWSVVKPNSEGEVTSVEAYAADGELIVQFFGLRKPGQPEREDWRRIVAELPGANR